MDPHGAVGFVIKPKGLGQSVTVALYSPGKAVEERTE